MSAGDVKAGGAYVEIYAKSEKAERALKNVQNRLNAFGNATAALGQKLVFLGAMAAAGLAPVMATLSAFEDKISAVGAVTNATTDDLAKLRAEAKRLGATTSFSASQVAEAMTFLGMAGFDTQQTLEGIPAVLQLARAGMIDLGMAADIASDVGQAFGFTAEGITRVADVMASTATGANTNIEMLGETFKYAAPLFNAAGQSIETAAAMAGQLGNNGIKASMAGTDLALIVKTMADPAARKGIEELGVSVIDSSGKIRNIIDIMADLDSALSGFSEADRLAFMANNFDRAAKSAQILSSQHQGLRQLETRIQGADGAAAEMARKMDDNLGGKFRALMSALEGTMIQLGETLAPVFIPLIDDATRWLGLSAEWIQQNEFLIRDVVTIVAQLTAMGGALLAAGTAIKLSASLVGGMITMVQGFQVALAATTGSVTGLALALGALAGVALAPVINDWINQASGLADELERVAIAAMELETQFSKKRGLKLAELDRMSKDDPGRQAAIQEELDRARKDLEGQKFRAKQTSKQIDGISPSMNFLYGGRLKSPLIQQYKDESAQARSTENYIAQLEKRLGTSSQLPTRVDPAAVDQSPLAGPQMTQDDLQAQILEQIRGPMEDFQAYVTALDTLYDSGKISESEYRAAYQQRQAQTVQVDEETEALKQFAEAIQGQMDPLAELRDRLSQADQAVAAGLIDQQTADAFKQQEAENFARSQDLGQRKEQGTARLNRAVDVNSAEGMNALISAIFKPDKQQKQEQLLQATVDAIVVSNKTLKQIKDELAGGTQETDFKKV